MNRKLLNIFFGLIAVISVIGVASCSSKKSAVSGTESVAGTYANPYQAMIAGNGEWTTLRVPVTLRLSGPKNLSIGGTATMVRDKSVTLSLRFFGMEIGQLYVASDSLIVIDKVNKQYMVQPIGKILSGFDVNVANLQDLLTGRAFLLGKESLTSSSEKDFNIKNENGGIVMTPKRQPSGATYSFAVENNGVVSLLTVAAGSHKPVSCSYLEPIETTAGKVAGSATIAAELKGKPVSLEFDWNFGKARWNDPSDNKEPVIPSGYTRRTPDELLKSAQKAL